MHLTRNSTVLRCSQNAEMFFSKLLEFSFQKKQCCMFSVVKLLFLTGCLEENNLGIILNLNLQFYVNAIYFGFKMMKKCGLEFVLL